MYRRFEERDYHIDIEMDTENDDREKGEGIGVELE
jgi:hypothetical protein